MNNSMTFNTNRFNIKPMLFGVAFVVMVLLSLFPARTFQAIWAGQSIKSDSSINDIACFYLICINNSVSLVGFSCDIFALFTTAVSVYIRAYQFFIVLIMTSYSSFTFTAFMIYFIGDFSTTFALPLETVFCTAILRKFSDWFNLLASAALFCYDCFRHGFFLIKKLCLEPLQTQYLCGLFYYTNYSGGVK